MTDRPPRLIPYTRQSLARKGETRETSLSLDAQEQVIGDWAEANGFVVASAIRDHDLKGQDPGRPGLAELTLSAQPGDTVAVYKWDRLARDVPLQETLVRQLQARNVQVISVTEPSTRLTRVIYGAVNEEFRDALSQRIKDARRLQAMRGHYTGAGTPYGYQRSQLRAIPLPDGSEYLQPTGILTIEPAEAAIVREGFERVVRGEAVYSIVVDFNNRGIPTRRNSTWQVSTLRRVIANPWYYGAATYRGEEIAPGLHEPLVDRDTWEAANRLACRPRSRQKKHDDVFSWLEGFVYHACGRRMYLMSLQSHRDRVKHSQHFACQTAYQPVRCGQPRRHISQRRLEAAVLTCLERDLAATAPLAEALQVATIVAGGPDVAKQRQLLEERRAKTLARYERVRDAWASGLESLDWLATEQERRDGALAEIERELAGLPLSPDLALFEQAAAALASLPAVLAEMAAQQLTALLAELGHVHVSEAGVQLCYDEVIQYFIPDPHLAVIG